MTADHDEDGHDALADAILERAQEGLVVGARVLTRIHDECVYIDTDGVEWRHSEWHDGITGVIVNDSMPCIYRPDHHFAIHADQPVGGYFVACAAELIPLAADGPDAGEE